MLLTHDIDNFATVQSIPKQIHFYETLPLNLACDDLAIVNNYLHGGWLKEDGGPFSFKSWILHYIWYLLSLW